MKFMLFLMGLICTYSLYSQPLVNVHVSADTIAVGEWVDIKYTIEGGEGRFQMPDLTLLPVVSGPNTSSSFMYSNGKVSSSQTYSFRLRPVEVGRIQIPETTYEIQGEVLTIQPVEVVVLAYRDRPQVQKKKIETAPVTPEREKRKF